MDRLKFTSKQDIEESQKIKWTTDYIKCKTFRKNKKNTVKNQKGNRLSGEKIFTESFSDKGLISKIYKELFQNKKHFLKEGMHFIDNHKKMLQITNNTEL